MSSTFSSYYLARSGIQNAQYNLKVTGQNMTNVNTTGYTRQRLDSSALPSTGMNSLYVDKSNLGIGEGVDSIGVSQLRDPYLDIRYRMAHAKTGMSGVQLDTMNDLETILDETNTKGINSQFEDLVSQLKNLAATPSDTNLENIVKSSSLLLTQAFHKAAEQIQTVRKQKEDSFQTDSVDKVNTLLKNIASVNEEIKSADISQTPALELLDKRNTYLDELSQYVDIETSTKTVSVGAGRTVDELQINMVSGVDNSKINLIDDNQFGKFELSKDASGAMQLSFTNSSGKQAKNGQGNVVSNSDFAKGQFAGYLNMLNGKGEYDTPTTSPRGIGYYEKTLDQLAGAFAQMMNNTNSTNVTITDPGNIAANLPNKPLFTTDDGTTTDVSKITAGNISISKAWNSAVGTFVTATKNDNLPGVDNSKAGKNILYMINQFTGEKTFYTDATKSKTLFSSSINSFMSTLSTTLGLDINTTGKQDTTYNSTLNEIDTQRQAISSVDVNDESINMIMYNQALSASSRFMTTLDQAIDTIINKMGVG